MSVLRLWSLLEHPRIFLTVAISKTNIIGSYDRLDCVVYLSNDISCPSDQCCIAVSSHVISSDNAVTLH